MWAMRSFGVGTIRSLLGPLALFSGVALLLNIIGGVDLRLGLLATTSIMAIGAFVLLRGLSRRERGLILGVIGVGALAGISATIAYDVTKATFMVLDPSPFDPFHAIHVFGTYLAGTDAPETAIVVAGWGFHLLNGTAFGVAYTLLFARLGNTTLRRALLTGLGWGIFLESFQLALYPGWLNIAAVNEFVLSSLLGHLIYGLTLGSLSRVILRTRVGGPEQGT
jgi:hypothetical protein